MQNKIITDLLASFDEQSDKVKICLTDLLDVVKCGCVPAPEAMSSLDSCVADLRTRYNAIYAAAKDSVSADELPECGVAVSVIADAVKNSRKKYLDEQLERASTVLKKFISIKSLIDGYATALAPYQSAAASLLDQMAEDTVEAFLPKMEAPGIFLEAMQEENIHSLSGIDLMTRVQENFPDMAITMGLLTKQYYFPADSDALTEADRLVDLADVAGGNPVVSLEEVIEEETEEQSAISAILPDTSGNPPVEDYSEVEVVPAEDESEEIVTYAIKNRVKTGTPSVSGFKKEIDKLGRYYSEIRTILPLFTNLGVLDKFQIFSIGVLMDCFDGGEDTKARVHAAVDMLVEKGYLAEFTAQHTTLYCLPNYVSACMQKESIKKSHNIFNISVGNVTVSANTEISITEALKLHFCNDTLFLYLWSQKDCLAAPRYAKIKESIKWCDDHYKIAFYDAGTLRTARLDFLIRTDDKLESPELDATDVASKYLIISKDNANDTTIFNSICEKVLVVDGGKIYFCDPKKNLMEQIKEFESTSDVNPEDDTAVELSEPEALPVEAPLVDAAKIIVETPTAESEPGTQTLVEDEAPSVEEVEIVPEIIEVSLPIEDEAEPVVSMDILTPQALLDLKRVPSDDEFCQVIHSLLCSNIKESELTATIVNAVLLARGAGLAQNCPKSKQLSSQLRLATNLMLDECNYSSEFLANAFGNADADVPALTLAAYMYALLTPAVMYDYGLKAQTEQYLSDYDLYFDGLDAFKSLFNKLMGVRAVKASGFTPAVIALLGNEAESERFVKALRKEAQANLTVNAPKTRMKALPVMYNAEFGTGSDLRQCLEIIAEGKTDSDSIEWVEEILSEYCEVTDGVYCVIEDKIEDHLNQAWDDANPKSKFKLEYDARDQALRQYRQRLAIMVKWVEHIRNSTGNKEDIDRLKTLRKDILKTIEQIRLDSRWRNVRDANVLDWLLTHMKNYLQDAVSNVEIYSDLLLTGIFSLTEEGTPEIDSSLSNIRYYEVWRNALKHIVAPRRSIDEITAEILGETLDAEAGLKDNLRQLSMLGLLSSSDDDVFVVSDGQAKEAADSANLRTEHFKDHLELAYTYYQINETEKENLAGIMNQYKSAFYEIKDFAAWRRFLEALEMQIQEFADGRKKGLRSRLSARLADAPTSALLLEAERLLEEDSNFAVTEEYLNRYEAGERDLDNTTLFDNDYFSDFLKPSVYDPLLQECVRSKGRALKAFGWTYLERHLPKDWTARLREDSKTLISNWPARKDTATPSQVQGLLKGLGIDVIKATKVTGRKEEMWQLAVKPSAKSLADYLHPIAAFGTQMKSPLQAIFLYGNYTEQQLVDTVTSMNLGTMSIVFIDRPIDAASRRYIGEIFHTQKTGQNPFLLVDQVLLLYLAMHQETERLPALLKCTLPYATYQPFVRDGGSTADEMFCGRALELATIIDPNGACVVYGGRQLGKTALLERAESRCSKPENKQYAVYSTIIRQKDESEVVETLLSDIERKTDGKISLKPSKTIRGMCSQLSGLFRSGQIVSMHLLIDEVDDFLGAIADESYKPIQPLVDLKRETKNNFKFVIAGLHNVCRAKNATKENGIFGQLGTPLCIKPLSPTDALQLLSKPLRYLGFQIDRYPHLETILTNTNYYPGILQFFGYILVETLTGQYSKYYHAADGNPPFTLQNDQLGAVMNSADLNKSIKDKFRWSLELDPRYFMIARCITFLYHIYEDDRTSGSWRGFSVDDVMSVAEEYEIHCLKDVTKAEYIILMDEMVEMGILGKPDDSTHTYRLRRNSFVDIIGESLEILENDIKANNVEG